MKKIAIIVFSLVILADVVFPQSIKKGFKLLEKLEYDKAKSVFSEIITTDNQNPAVNLGLALIYSDEKSPYFNLIQAWSHCRIVQGNMDKLLQEDMEIIGEYFINTEQRRSSQPVKKKIEYAVGIIEAHLIKYIREENSLPIVSEVIEKFPDFRYYENVIHIRNQLEFRKYEKQNTLEGYIEFIKAYPDAAQIEKAIRYRNKLAYERACQVNTLEAYKNYIREYPDAEEYNMAVKRRNAAAFHKAKTINTMQSYEEYIHEYPGALEVAEAKLQQKQLLYEYAKKIKTLEAYNEFIRKYPEGQQYIDIFNLKSLETGMKYLSCSSFTSDNIQWARSFDFNGENETTGTIVALPGKQKFLGITTRKSDTVSTDIWMLGVDNDGKMLWNKTTGGNFDDQVLFSALNHRNEILLAGYTWIAQDSAAREVWLFKQGLDGKNIWSQQLGKWTINSLLVDEDNNILLGGYQLDDSLRKKYRITVLNDMARKLWSRTYSGFGEIRYMENLPDHSILVVANNWIFKMDKKGYIKWEFIPSQEITYFSGLVSANGEFYLGGARNNHYLLLTKFGADGKILWDKQHLLTDSLVSIKKMIAAGSVKTLLLFAICRNTGNEALWISNLTGEIQHTTSVSDDRVSDALIDTENNLWLLLENANAVLIKNRGVDF
ncbi:MAG: hypothetical protein JW973_02860 [Bacteroidales bacterium]|nr:hypothetical protein [Bacteroidales bacterium]